MFKIFKFFFKNNKNERAETKIKNALYKSVKHCHYCGIKMDRDEVTLDHVIPVSKGGETSLENSQICCMKCNTLKADSDYDDFKIIVNTVEKRDFYWKKYENKINKNIVIDIVYPYLNDKIKEYKLRVNVAEKQRGVFIKTFGKDSKRVKDITTKKNNIEKEIFKLRRKIKNYKKEIPNYESN